VAGDETVMHGAWDSEAVRSWYMEAVQQLAKKEGKVWSWQERQCPGNWHQSGSGHRRIDEETVGLFLATDGRLGSSAVRQLGSCQVITR
jgi:uncharacterized protein YfaT (DUF1175 family)